MKRAILLTAILLGGMAFAHDLDAICAENEHVDDELDEVGFCSLSLEAQRRQLNNMMVTTRRLNNPNRYYFDPRETGSREHIQLRRPGMEGWTFAQVESVGGPFRRGENRVTRIYVDDGEAWKGTVKIGRISDVSQRWSHKWTVKVEHRLPVDESGFPTNVMRWTRDRIGPPRWTTGGYPDAGMTIPEAIAVVEGLLDCMAQGVEVAAFPEQCPITH